MFKNADEITNFEKMRNKERISSNGSKNEKSEMKGAIILSYSKELIN